MSFINRIKIGLWWERAWSLVEGCSPRSSGCDNCWAAAQANMRGRQQNAKIQQRYRGLNNADGSWNGQIRLLKNNILLPYETKKPTVWAIWNDLFHEDVSDDFIDDAYRLMDLFYGPSGHKYIILTKRVDRLLTYMKRVFRFNCESRSAPFLFQPLNIYTGTSAENQLFWDLRKQAFFEVCVAHKFVSFEPLLGEIKLTPGELKKINQVIVGGETGRKARPMHPDWVRRIRDDCGTAGVPFYFKQWGKYTPQRDRFGDSCFNNYDNRGKLLEWVCTESTGSSKNVGKKSWYAYDDLGKAFHLKKINKQIAGRLLDGREHNDLIWGPEDNHGK